MNKRGWLKAVGITAVAGALFAGCGHHHKMGMHSMEEFKTLRSAMHSLDLSGEQKEALKALKEETRTKRQEMMQSRVKDMVSFIGEESLDSKGLRGYLKDHTPQMIDLHVDMIEKAYAILTPEQRKELGKKLHEAK